MFLKKKIFFDRFVFQSHGNVIFAYFALELR